MKPIRTTSIIQVELFHTLAFILITLPIVASHIPYRSITELGRLIRTKQVSPVELARNHIERSRSVDPQLLAFVLFTEDLAMEQARAAEHRMMKGKLRSPLDGIPWGVKDLFATAGIPTQWGSPAYQGQVFDYDATVVRKLRESGAVLIGKLASGELASGARWFGGTTRCPWDPSRSSSGSSAGPAAATAAGLVAFSVGTETLGSIISPAATNGVVGLRPTYGRVSRYGAMALSWTMDKVGPICRTVDDCALVFRQIQGEDPLDPTTVGAVYDRPGAHDLMLRPVGLALRGAPLQPGKHIAIIREEFNAASDPDVAAVYRQALNSLESLGLILEDIHLEDYPYQEIARHTLNIEAATVFEPLWKTGRIEMLLNQTRATDWSAARLLPATDYLKMQRLRTEICDYSTRLFKKYSGLVAPALTLPAAAVEAANAGANPVTVTGGGVSLAFGNITGIPAISVPCGFTSANLPLGIQLIGPAFEEGALLRVAYAYEQANSWLERHPAL
jgi:Asp-tRNA(Asn)/Glu-tRNA(Gln) amidotransferase A subunit family amidase